LIEPVRPARAVLTIENLASFNRHVREARLPDDVVLYTGGFPSRAVISALTAVAKWPGVSRIYHWGDIDESGLKIALHLAERLPIPVVPHLMTFDLARTKGARVRKIKAISLPHGSPWTSLAMFLEGEDSHFLEQEVVDPMPIDLRDRLHQPSTVNPVQFISKSSSLFTQSPINFSSYQNQDYSDRYKNKGRQQV
jgi:hypothetical protein